MEPEARVQIKEAHILDISQVYKGSHTLLGNFWYLSLHINTQNTQEDNFKFQFLRILRTLGAFLFRNTLVQDELAPSPQKTLFGPSPVPSYTDRASHVGLNAHFSLPI